MRDQQTSRCRSNDEARRILDELQRYIEGPEHNAYYDLLDLVAIIADQLTPKKRKEIADFINERNRNDQL